MFRLHDSRSAYVTLRSYNLQSLFCFFWMVFGTNRQKLRKKFKINYDIFQRRMANIPCLYYLPLCSVYSTVIRHMYCIKELYSWYTHKTSGFKTSGSKRPVSKRLKRQVYKTSGLQNVRFTKCQVYKTSGLQNFWLKKKHPYIFYTFGWWKSAGLVAAMFADKVMAVFYSLF